MVKGYVSFKPAINYDFEPLGAVDQAVNTTLTYYHLMELLQLLENSGLFTSNRPGATSALNRSRVSVHRECKFNIHSPFSSVFGLHQLLREITDSLAAKFSTMFTS